MNPTIFHPLPSRKGQGGDGSPSQEARGGPSSAAPAAPFLPLPFKGRAGEGWVNERGGPGRDGSPKGPGRLDNGPLNPTCYNDFAKHRRHLAAT